MSNKGGHGAGTAHETETPIVAWGAGVKYWKHIENTKHRFKNSSSFYQYDKKCLFFLKKIKIIIPVNQPKSWMMKFHDLILNKQMLHH